jgi:hypothetical protein
MTVENWLLEGDPAIRWQVLRDIAAAPAHIVAAERARVATEGWGARLLAEQRPDGQWGDGDATPFWWSNLYTLVFLRDLGVEPESAPVRAAVDRVRDHVSWGPWFGDSPFFEGEVEPCINGGTLALGSYFGRPTASLARRLVGEQLDDGGWNCEAPKSARSSFHTTICVLEGLLEYERAVGPTPETTAARRRGEEYLLERALFRRKSTGEVASPAFLELAFPPRYHYDVLRALDYFRSAGGQPDARIGDAVRVIDQKRQADGRWLLDRAHDEALAVSSGDSVGEPSRWNTLRALRVLRWYKKPSGD